MPIYWRLSALFLFTLFTACQPSAPTISGEAFIMEAIASERFAEARDSLRIFRALPRVQGDGRIGPRINLYDARLTYYAGDFRAAMDGARRALRGLTRPGHEQTDEVVIDCLHLLAQLHADRAAHTDSIWYYQRWAAELITAATPPAVRAEKALVLSLAQLYDYEYKTQMTAARLGKSLLAEHPGRHELYGRLLVTEGLGLKKHADLQREPLRTTLLEEAAGLMAEAVDRFGRAGSIRWREAQREKVIIVSRFLDRGRFEEELRPLVSGRFIPTNSAPAAAPTPFIPFGFPDRLRGYFNHRHGRADSTLYYYERFQEKMPAFDFHLADETHWTIIRYGVIEGQLELAETNVRNQLILYECLDESDRDSSPAEILAKSLTTKRCTYALCDFGRIKLADFTNNGNAESLREANAVFQYILDAWETIFISGEEESALNQLTEITYKIINNANEAAYLGYERAPTPANAERVLRTMERTKSFLLLKDRLGKAKRSEASARFDSLKVWQSQLNTFKEREVRTGQLSAADRQTFQTLRRRHREVSAELRAAQRASGGGGNQAIPTIAQLQSELAPGAGMLIYATGNDRLIGQFLNEDKTIAFATPPLEELTVGVNELLTYLTGDHRSVSVGDYASLAESVSKDLFGPVADEVASLKELLVVPAGPLRRLPFATLLAGDGRAEMGGNWSDLPYLIQQMSIAYAPSLRVERLNAAGRPETYAHAKVGAWTHPDFRVTFQRTNERLAALAGGGTTFYGENDCTSNSFRAYLGEYDILNLTLHASGDPGNAYNNYLFFSPTDSLNGAAVSQLRTEAKLVLLTACETGLGQATVGEGTFSIGRGFQQLGVADVVYSLWRISPASSAELVERFYVHLFDGYSPVDALTLAQRELMRGERGRIFGFVGYWGGMVMG